MYVCMYVCLCMYVYAYVCVYTTYMYILFMHVCTCIYMCVYLPILYVFMCVSMYKASIKIKTVTTVTKYINTVHVEKLIAAKLVCPQSRATTPVRVRIYPSLFP
jgi:hypothetical protein